jgi:hypothetical protein
LCLVGLRNVWFACDSLVLFFCVFFIHDRCNLD